MSLSVLFRSWINVGLIINVSSNGKTDCKTYNCSQMELNSADSLNTFLKPSVMRCVQVIVPHKRMCIFFY